MSYKSVRSDHVNQTIARLLPLHAPVAAFVEEMIQLLEKSPTALSRAGTNILRNGQLYQFETTFQGMEYRFDLIFRYGADEQTLHLEYLLLETI